MPSTSRKQAIAMELARRGKSNIGIPQSVGEDFSHADERNRRFLGVHRKRKQQSADK